MTEVSDLLPCLFPRVLEENRRGSSPLSLKASTRHPPLADDASSILPLSALSAMQGGEIGHMDPNLSHVMTDPDISISFRHPFLPPRGRKMLSVEGLRVGAISRS